jgi:hypothetical protein
MGALKRLAAVVVAVLALAPAAAAAPLTVRTSFDDATVQFGDVVRAHVAVLVAEGASAGSVRVTEDLAPLTPVSPLQVERHGDVVEVTRSFVCLTAACVSDRGDATPKLAPVQVAARVGGRSTHAVKAWPALHVRGRVTSADLSRSSPPFRASRVPPAPSYAIAPGTLAWLLDAGAAVLALAAVALVAVQLRRRASRRRAPRQDELTRAVRFAREAETRPVPDRRRAIGLLARVLRSRDARLATAARDLAWARPQPERDEVEQLVGDVERTAPS